ncbi:aldose-1-epimerase [Actinomyces sp. MRS3W]|uniref:aldose-1-epimerase n=1 Tax=Actinomyces sp. MRS3W TaxID=2800796 RepID=UPI0028FD68E0|nr:aldose-1-epimerase [Actinomyces sp. MRS3W]MDU0348741.1 aldose-1-epimerase [Actinomyces sp. MRS3W]
MHDTSLNGELIDLRAGDYEARIATSGATLVHLRRLGHDLVIPFDADAALPGAWQGKTLVPWPNRIADARYTYRGVDYLVPCNEPETGAALHGLIGWTNFAVAPAPNAATEQPSAVTLTLDLPASYAYPWSLHISVCFTLDAATGLTVTTTSTCTGAALSPAAGVVGAPEENGVPAPAPYGVSCHPYLTRSVPLDECTLQVPAGRVLDVDAHMAPAGEREVAGTDWDWRTGRLVGITATDNAYTGLPSGTWQVRLTGGEGGHSVVMEAAAPWVQVYSGEHLARRGVAVEPMTCPPNAFNTGQDLLTLAAGQSHSFTWSLWEED